MTDTPAGATDLLAPPAAAPFDAPEAVAARAAIQKRIPDKAFGKLLLAKDEAATREWAELHRTGFPPPASIANIGDVNDQATVRREEAWNGFFAAVEQRHSLTDANKAELREGVVNEALRNWAVSEKDRLIKDARFRRALLDGGRAEARDWSIIQLILGLKPVKDYRSPHATR